MRAYSKFFLIFITGVVVTACTKNSTEPNQSLRIHLPVVSLNLDPQRMEDAYSMGIVTQIHRGLLRYNNDGDVKADLAESWTESPDRRTYKFKLKKTTFSDGSPITAKHVQMTFARLFRLGASMAADIDYIEGSKSFKESLTLSTFGIKALSENEVEFRLAKPSALFLKQLAVADCAILSLNDFKEDPNLTSGGKFSGPYKISKNLSEGSVEIKKWRHDELESPHPPETVIYFMTDEDPVTLAKEKKTDSLDHVTLKNGERRELEKLGWAPAPTELAGEVFVVLNPALIPEPVRKLLYSSIEPKQLLQSLGPRPFKPAYGLIPFGLAGELKSEDVGDLRVPIQSYLGPKITIELDYEAGSELEQRTVEYLKKRWEQQGVEIKTIGLSKREKLAKLFAKNAQAILARKAMDYPDGFSVLGYFKGNYESNYFFANDAKIDAALLKVLQIFDTEERAREYRKIQLQILKHGTIIPLLFGSEASGLWSQKLKSVPSHPLGAHTLPMETVEIETP